MTKFLKTYFKVNIAEVEPVLLKSGQKVESRGLQPLFYCFLFVLKS